MPFDSNETHSVTSTTILTISYDEDFKVLKVQFVNGNFYEFIDVPEEIYTDFLNATSAGSYFHHNIRGKYAYIRID